MSGFEDEEIAEKNAVQAFRDALATGSLEAFVDALGEVEKWSVWRQAFGSVTGLDPPAAIRSFVLELYVDGGAALRSNVHDDRVLVEGLQVLLPPYEGNGMRLWRGANKVEQKLRTYGHAWTSDLEVARCHAFKPQHGGQGVVLQTDAPPESIICAPHQETKSFHEREYILNTRLLKEVRVIESQPNVG